MPRADKGKPRGPRGKYNINSDNSGKTDKENIVQRSFWRFHKMVDIIQLTPEELDQKINSFLEEYEKRQIRQNPRWWYPITDKNNLKKIRNKRTDIDKGWHL